ncbi:MAG: type II toxin-antitoxin system death-on-curing family toxin [Desulfobacteraceae bacterium]|nr:type II toxin-antitoxin system death-on-curing family toxin [Desulfobacteraceae bacterium]
MTCRWILLETVLAIHDRQIDDHGGMAGVRDRGLIESAVNRPQTITLYEDRFDIFDLAAAYGFALVQNHGFYDGNKRTAYTVTRLFLELNGYSLTVSPADRVIMFLKCARGEAKESDLAEWLRKNSQKNKTVF